MALSKGHTFTSGEVVTPTKLNNLVDNATIGDGTITTAMIADDAVTADKIATGAVTTDALASDALGASSIDDLTDVDTSSVAPTDGQALVWDNANSKWEPGTVSSGSSSEPRAFVAFDGTSSNLTGSITNSLNVTSITDQGTGLYDIAWTNTVANPVFTVAAENHNNQLGLAGLANITSSGVRLVGHSISSGASNPPYISIVAH